MGSVGSTLLPAPDDRLLKSIKILNLSNSDLAKIFAIFNKQDKAHQGCLPLGDMYKMLGERKSIFGDSLFELIDVRDFRELIFSEWLDAITTFCLFEEEDILKYCFFVLDHEKNGYIDKEDMRMLVNMLHYIRPGEGLTGNMKIAFDKLFVQPDETIEFSEFKLLNKVFPSLLFPAFRLQLKMMQAVLGERWWNNKKRHLQEGRRRNDEVDSIAETKRLEAMRQMRIRRHMGACKYYCWPCGREAYDNMFPKAFVPDPDPKKNEPERPQKKVDKKVMLQRDMEEHTTVPETLEYKRYREKVDAMIGKQKNQRYQRIPGGRQPLKKEHDAYDRRLRLENRRAKNGRRPTT